MSLLFFVSLIVSYCMDSPSNSFSPSSPSAITVSATNNPVATTNPLISTTSDDLLATIIDRSLSANASTSNDLSSTTHFLTPIDSISTTDLPASTLSNTFAESLATTINSSQHVESSTLESLSSFAMRGTTEADFVEQAEHARTALQQFIAVKDFDNAEDVRRNAFNKVMKYTVRSFIFLIHSSCFQLIFIFLFSFSCLLTVSRSSSIILYSSKFRLPFTRFYPTSTRSTRLSHCPTTSLSSMDFAIALTTISSLRLTKVCFFFFPFIFCFTHVLFFFLAAVAAANLRPSRGRKTVPTVVGSSASVSQFLFFFISFYLFFSLSYSTSVNAPSRNPTMRSRYSLGSPLAGLRTFPKQRKRSLFLLQRYAPLFISISLFY